MSKRGRGGRGNRSGSSSGKSPFRDKSRDRVRGSEPPPRRKSGKKAGHEPTGSVVYELTQRLLREDEDVDVRATLGEALSREDKPLRADPRAFTTFASRLVRAKLFERALEVFEAQRELGVERSVVSYNQAMVAHVKRGAPEDAIKIFDELTRVGHEPSVISYNVVMGACTRCGNGAEALRLYEEMVAKGMELDAVSVNTAIAAAESIGDNARAETLRRGSPFARESEVEPSTANAADSDSGSDSGDDSGDDDDSGDGSDGSEEPAFLKDSAHDDEPDRDAVDEDEESKRAAARKRKREAKERLLAEYEKSKASAAGRDDDEDEEMAKRRRKDARRERFEAKRKARKEANRVKRPWTVAAAHASKRTPVKSAKEVRRKAMKADPRVWVEDVDYFSDGDVRYDEDGERVLPPITGPSFLDDPRAAKLMNAKGSDDFWSVGF